MSDTIYNTNHQYICFENYRPALQKIFLKCGYLENQKAHMTVIRAMQQLNVSLKSSRPNDIFVVQGYFTYDWHNEWMRSTSQHRKPSFGSLSKLHITHMVSSCSGKTLSDGCSFMMCNNFQKRNSFVTLKTGGNFSKEKCEGEKTRPFSIFNNFEWCGEVLKHGSLDVGTVISVSV